MKENSIETIRHNDTSHSGISDQTGTDDATTLLVKIQRQLSHLERKIDDIMRTLQEGQSRAFAPGRKSDRTETRFRPSQNRERFTSRKPGKGKGRSGDTGAKETFYSRFSKPGKRSGYGTAGKPGKRPSGRQRQEP